MEGSVGKLYEKTWRVLLDDRWVQDFLDDRETAEAWKVLRGQAQDKLQEHRELLAEVLEPAKLPETSSENGEDGTKHEQRQERSFVTKLPEREKKRADVLLMISMGQAAERPDVKRFRDERLGGQNLFYDDGEAFISPGLREEITDRELADLARRLEREYGWRQDDAAWFVLTNRTPRLRPLIAGVFMHQSTYPSTYGHSHCTITLHVAPWVSPEEVEKAFVQARDGVRGGSGAGTVSERRLEVLRFVEKKYEKREPRPPFKELLQMWNREYPQWAYSDYRALSKAYREARQEVFNPKYQMPNAGQR